jgi:hypothetical protein
MEAKTMAEITLEDVAHQFDELYFKMEALNSLAYVLLLASNSDSLASDFNGALTMLSDETRYIFDKVDGLYQKIYETIEGQKVKVKDEG